MRSREDLLRAYEARKEEEAFQAAQARQQLAVEAELSRDTPSEMAAAREGQHREAAAAAAAPKVGSLPTSAGGAILDTARRGQRLLQEGGEEIIAGAVGLLRNSAPGLLVRALRGEELGGTEHLTEPVVAAFNILSGFSKGLGVATGIQPASETAIRGVTELAGASPEKAEAAARTGGDLVAGVGVPIAGVKIPLLARALNRPTIPATVTREALQTPRAGLEAPTPGAVGPESPRMPQDESGGIPGQATDAEAQGAPAAGQGEGVPRGTTQPSIQPKAVGKRATVITERGTSVEADYALVDARDLVASHDTAFRPRPEFPPELQPRDRTRTASEIQAQRIEENLVPRFLGESPKASEGAPIIGPDGVVESGNLRSIVLQRLYEGRHPNSVAYKQWLTRNAERFGFTADQVDEIDRPVVVRIRRTEVDRAAFAREANEAAVAAMSASETAKADATQIAGLLDDLKAGETGDLNTAGNRDFFRAFFQKVVPTQELGRFMDSKGFLSQEGLTRVRNAVFATVFEDPNVVARLTEATDDNIKRITNGILAAAPRLAKVKAAIGRGDLHALDIGPDLAVALNRLSELRKAGVAVEDFLAQRGLFGDELTPFQAQLLTWLNTAGRSTKAVGETLTRYADLVEEQGSPKQGGLFGETAAPTVEGLFRRAAAGEGAQAGLFSEGTPKAASVSGEAGGAVISSDQSPPPGIQLADGGSQRSSLAPPSGVSTARSSAPSARTGPSRTTGEVRVAPIDRSSGRIVLQPTDDVNELVRLAQEGLAGLRAELGAIAQAVKGVELVGVRAKARPRLAQKLLTRTADTISDYLGGRFSVDSRAALDGALEELRTRFDIIHIEDFLETGKDGYRAVHVEVRLPNGLAAEIQFVPKPIADIQHALHETYEKWRHMPETLTAEQLAERKRDLAAMRQQFDDAFAKWKARADADVGTRETAGPPPGPVSAERAAARELANAPAKDAPPDRRLKVGRGAHGQVEVIFEHPDDKDLFAAVGRSRRQVSGQKGIDPGWNRLRAVYGLPPGGSIGAVAQAYRDSIMAAVKNLPEGATFHAPRPEIPGGGGRRSRQSGDVDLAALLPLARAALGAGVGATTGGDTPEEKVHRALVGAGLGAVASPALIRRLLARTGRQATPTTAPPTRAPRGELVTVTPRSQAGRAAAAVDELAPEVEDLPALFEEPKDLKLEGRVLGINFDRIETTDDVKAVLARVAQVYQREIDAGRKIPQTHAKTIAEADARGLTVEEFLAMRTDRPLSPAEQLAGRKLLVASAERLRRLADLVAEEGDDAAKLALVKQAAIHIAIQRQEAAFATRAGQVLESRKIVATGDAEAATRLGQVLEDLRTGVTAERLAQMVRALDTPEQINKMLHLAQKPTVGDALVEAWINALLSGPQSHAANAIGNTLTTFRAVGERYLAAGIGLGREGHVQVGEANALTYGLVAGLRDGFRLAAKALREGQPSARPGKVEIPHRKAITGETFGLTGPLGHAIDLLGEAWRLPSRFLQVADEFFYGVNYRMELHAQAYREALRQGAIGDNVKRVMAEILADPPASVSEEANRFALLQTFQRDLDSPILRALAASRNPAVKVIVPFVRTPANIFRDSIERIPGLNMVLESVRADVAAGGHRADLAYAKMALGGAAMGVAAWLASEGLITGGGPKDPNLKRELRDTGWQPYSLKIGDTYVSFARFEPVATLFGLVADAVEIAGEVDDLTWNTVAFYGTLAAAKNITSKTFLQGFADAVEAIDDPERFGAQFVKGFTRSLVPGAVAQVERTITDPTLRETQDLDLVRELVNELRSRIPGYSEDLPPRRNLFGEPIRLTGGLGPDLISPVYTSTRRADPVAEEILRLRLSLAMPPESLGGVPLDPQEYDRYVQLAAGLGLEGQPTLRERLEREFASESYQRRTDGPDGGKAVRIRDIIQSYRQRAEAQLRKEFPVVDELIADQQRQRIERLRPAAIGIQ